MLDRPYADGGAEWSVRDVPRGTYEKLRGHWSPAAGGGGQKTGTKVGGLSASYANAPVERVLNTRITESMQGDDGQLYWQSEI